MNRLLCLPLGLCGSKLDRFRLREIQRAGRRSVWPNRKGTAKAARRTARTARRTAAPAHFFELFPLFGGENLLKPGRELHFQLGQMYSLFLCQFECVANVRPREARHV